MTGGVFAITRGVFDHPMFAPEPFTEREAWIWLVGAAAWKASRVRVGRTIVPLKRGQYAFSVRFIARKWRWAEARVRRFLKRLTSDAMIVALATHEATHITICNYEKYAFDRHTHSPEIDASPDAKKKKEEIRSKKESCAVADATRTSDVKNVSQETFEAFWKAYPKRKGGNPKAPAAKLFSAAVKQGTDPGHIVAAIEAKAGFDPDKIGTEYIPQAVKWLRDKRWEEFTPPDPQAVAARDARMAKLGWVWLDGRWQKTEATHAAA